MAVVRVVKLVRTGCGIMLLWALTHPCVGLEVCIAVAGGGMVRQSYRACLWTFLVGFLLGCIPTALYAGHASRQNDEQVRNRTRWKICHAFFASALAEGDRRSFEALRALAAQRKDAQLADWSHDLMEELRRTYLRQGASHYSEEIADLLQVEPPQPPAHEVERSPNSESE